MLVFSVGQKIKEVLVVLGRGRYQTEANQVIRMWGQFHLEGNGRTQVQRVKNIINMYPKWDARNTFVVEISANRILRWQAKVALYLLTGIKTGYVQLLKIYVKTLCTELQLSPE